MRPSGERARAWGRSPGSSTVRPSGVSTWLTGVTVRLAPLRPTRSVVAGVVKVSWVTAGWTQLARRPPSVKAVRPVNVAAMEELG